MKDPSYNFFFKLVILITVFSCSKPNEREPPVTVSETLNDLVRSVPFQYIDLNGVEVYEIDITEEDIIYSVNHAELNDKFHLGQITGFTFFDEQFYIFDSIASAIFQVDPEGNIKGPLTRKGRGPGEHNFISNLKANSSYIYAADGNNGRINRYTHTMMNAEPLGNFIQSMSGNEIDLNNDKILTVNRLSSGFSPPNSTQGLIAVSSIRDLTDTLATILPRIIPVGYQPNVYNIPRFSINRQNQISATYNPLPWIFLFDEDYNHTRTLILEYSVFEEMSIPPLDFFKPKENEGFGGMMPLTQYKLMDNGDIFITIPSEVTHASSAAERYQPFGSRVTGHELIHISLSIDDSHYTVAKYVFNYSGQEESVKVLDLYPSGKKSEFYAGNGEYLFRFVLPD